MCRASRLAGDLLEVDFGKASPDLPEIAAKFSQAVPEGAEMRIIDLMSRDPHSQVIKVLTVLGKRHPDCEMAKAVRKSARRARQAAAASEFGASSAHGAAPA